MGETNSLKNGNRFGFIEQISNDVYHSGHELSSSAVKCLCRSGLDYHYTYRLGNKTENASMFLGSVFHCMILEPDKFKDRYVYDHDYPNIDRRTKDGKLAYDKLQKEIGTREVISVKDYVVLDQMEASFHSDSSTLKFYNAYKKELSAYWVENFQDQEIPCRARFDMLTEDDIIADIKTTQDATPEEFSHNIYKYMYHISAAWYCRGFERVTGRAPKGFVFIACSTKPPYSTYVYQLDEGSIDVASRRIDKALSTYIECKKTDLWPKKKYPTMIGLPDWAHKKEEMELLL